MRKPGALHRDRFLASAICIFKIAILLYELPSEMVNIVEEKEIKQMAQYISLFHMPCFLQVRLLIAAPKLDLTLWKDMKTYVVYDANIVDQIQKSILRHMWYLKEQLVACL